MAFMLSKNQSSFSGEAQSKDGGEALGSVSTHLSLKSSSRSLEKEAVLRRLRHHKTMNRVKNAFHAIMAPQLEDLYDEKWLQQGDSFSSP